MVEILTIPPIIDIAVTQDHIDKGELSACQSCPTALATIDVVGGGLYVGVFPQHIRIGPPRSPSLGIVRVELVYVQPKKARDFIIDFDGRGRECVKPLKFTAEFKYLRYETRDPQDSGPVYGLKACREFLAGYLQFANAVNQRNKLLTE